MSFNTIELCGLLTSLLLAAPARSQTVRIRTAEPAEFAGLVDSNSPVYWNAGTRYAYNSFEIPIRSEGGASSLSPRARAVQIQGASNRYRWIESVHSGGGYVFAWYHAEPATVCSGRTLATPVIGALVSEDGIHFDDLGIVLQAPAPPDCETRNIYFAGGLGDFSVVLDRTGQYFYFFYTNYGGPVEQQGIAVARMGVEDRWAPAGRVWKFHAGAWDEPGIRGIADPIFPVERSWNTDRPLAYWGPSVHWNTALQQYVVLMNQAIDSVWNQGGVYIGFSPDLANPLSWTTPVELMYAEGWYPQVMGSGPGETDSLAGAKARLFVMGRSEWELIFEPGPARIVHELRAPRPSTFDSPSRLSSGAGSTSASPRRTRHRE